MLYGLFFIAVGLGLLIFGAKLLVRGSSVLALLLKLSPFVIGLTIVAFGTSAPELFVSLNANLQGLSQLVMGNLIGSNIINITLVLGIGALILPVPVEGNSTLTEWIFMFVTSLIVGIMIWNLHLSRGEGFILILLMAIIVGFFLWKGRQDPEFQKPEGFVELSHVQEKLQPGSQEKLILINTGFVVLGLVLLYLGSEGFIKGAVHLAEIWGWDERIVGLTVVAFGTGLPELVTVIVATTKGRSDLAVGNLLGSNIFNLVGILGVCAWVKPLAVDRGSLVYDMSWLLVVSVFILMALLSRNPIGRWKGAFFFLSYCVYVVSLYVV